MKLLNRKIALAFPAIYATEDQPEEARAVIAKFFDPTGSGTWYAIEADALVNEEEETWKPLAEVTRSGEPYFDVKFFGLAVIAEAELGYFLLSELSAYRGPLGIGIERDLYYEGRTLADARKAS